MTLSRPERHRIQQIAKGRSDEALWFLEGPKSIHEALARGQVAELWLRADAEPALVASLSAAARAAGLTPREAGRAEFERLGRTVSPQGAFALVHDVTRPLAEVLDMSAERLTLWLDGVQDPGNVGAVFRVAAAFGVGGVLVGAGSAHPLGTKALRASTGLALRVPFACADAAEIAAACVAAGRTVWGLDAGGRPILDPAPVPGGLVLALGSEGQGLGPEAAAAAGASVGIEMAPDIESLNVAVAAGIAVAALTRAARSPA